MTRTTRFAVVAIACALTLAACGDDGTPAGQNGDTQPTGTDTTGTDELEEGDAPLGTMVTIQLDAQNDSGIVGAATIRQELPGQIFVSVSLNGAGEGPQPIHIHPGTCAELDPQPQYPLTDVAGGLSETAVEVGLLTLQEGEFAINVHKSPEEASVYVACGDIV